MEYRNARYINDNGWIYCEINSPAYGWIPYTLNPDDTDMTVNNNELLAAMSANGNVSAYEPPSQAEIDAKNAKAIRVERNAKLETEVDPLVSNPLRWAELAPDSQAEWTAYRTALLNITDQSTFPTSVTWPTKPN